MTPHRVKESFPAVDQAECEELSVDAGRRGGCLGSAVAAGLRLTADAIAVGRKLEEQCQKQSVRH
jgi:hypothetical protein